jgi:hypothetical protein
MQLPRYQIFLYQLIPILVLLLPLLEAAGLAVYWRRSLSNPWLYALAGTVVAYAVAAGVLFASEKYESIARGGVGSGYAVWRDDGQARHQTQSTQISRSDSGPMFAPLTPRWFWLLGAVVLLCGVALWALKFLFRSAAP